MAETFKLPTPKQIARIRRELKLGATQANELELTLRHAHADLQGYYRTRIGRGLRKVRMDRLKAVDQAIGKLSSLLEKDLELINEDLPFDARVAIGWCMSSQLIEAVTGERVWVRGRRVPHKEEAVGLRHGARLLAAQLRLIRDSFLNVLAEKSSDAGGPEANHVQVTLIRALAASAPAIIGRRATGTANGKFEKLVGAVFETLDIETNDLRKAIERTLYRKSSRPKARK
jgi:hypothetical protein